MKRIVVALAALAVSATIAAPSAFADEAADQAARWREVSALVFGERAIEDGADILKLTAPDRAIDAALVPITVEFTGAQPVVAVSVTVDNNPSPLVGTFRLGPAFAQQRLKMRVRVNEYTLIHAIAETADGKLHAVSRYVKAAGGCSAPSATASFETTNPLGRMQMRRDRAPDPGTVPTQVMIRHPNYSGMQQDPRSGAYTPARYIETMSVSVGGAKAFDLEAGISMSEDPSIAFTYLVKGDGAVDVRAKDSAAAAFVQRFDPLP